jgi:hypothetical protein
MWTYTEIENHKLEISPFYIKKYIKNACKIYNGKIGYKKGIKRLKNNYFFENCFLGNTFYKNFIR